MIKEIFNRLFVYQAQWMSMNTIWDFGRAGLIFGIGVIFLLLFHLFFEKKIRGFISDRLEEKFEPDDGPAPIKGFFSIGVTFFLYIAVFSLHMSEALKARFNSAFGVILTLLLIRALNSWMERFLISYWKKKEKKGKKVQKYQKVMLPMLKILIWIIGMIFLLDNLGFSISAIVAGLGIGGIAVALAAQKLLGDFLSYVSILLDRPFELGDFIILDQYMGTIEYIGIKTTHIRSLSGEVLVFSNTDITNSRIRNYQKMVERRVVFHVEVVYQTPTEQLEKIPGMIKNIIESENEVRFDRSHFMNYEGSGLKIETVYYVLSSDYAVYMSHHQSILLNIKRQFEREGIEFAYPTQTLYLNQETIESMN